MANFLAGAGQGIKPRAGREILAGLLPPLSLPAMRTVTLTFSVFIIALTKDKCKQIFHKSLILLVYFWFQTNLSVTIH